MLTRSQMIDQVFRVCDRGWRGIGVIPQSGFRLTPEFRDYDAEQIFDVGGICTEEPALCISGEILRGLKKPLDCPAFGKECSPERPLGATMVSAEGACAAYYNNGRHLVGIGMPNPSEDRADEMPKDFVLACPVPITERKTIVLGHGSGGKLSAQLVRDLFLPAFDNEYLRRLDDQAVFEAGSARLAFTTDSFVVTPLFFPGGNIGELAVNGTVNDLAMSGAKPLFLSSAFIIEEGLAIEELSRIVRSDGAGGAACRCRDCYRRYQGGQPWFRRQTLHHDRRHWTGAGRRHNFGIERARGGSRDRQRLDCGSWNGRTFRARRHGVWWPGL